MDGGRDAGPTLGSRIANHQMSMMRFQRNCSEAASCKGNCKLGGWVFLGVVILAYGITVLVEPGPARQALVSFIKKLQEVAPVPILVFALMFLAERYLTPERTRAWLGIGSGLRGWLVALLAGVLSTGPVYTWYGLLADLRIKGMHPALVAVVLYARGIKLPLLPLLTHYFGLRYVVVLSLSIAVFPLVNGMAIERMVHCKSRPPCSG